MTPSKEVTLSSGRVLRVVTEHVRAPIPTRERDWTAVDDRTYDGSGPIGLGSTQEEAIRALVEQICEQDDTCLPDCWACAQEARS